MAGVAEALRAVRATDVATGSATFVLLDGMTRVLTVDTATSDVFVSFTTSLKSGGVGVVVDVALFMDNVEQFRVRTNSKDKDDIDSISLSHLVQDPGAGSHTFEIRWRVDSTTVAQSGATWGAGRSLTVMELTN